MRILLTFLTIIMASCHPVNAGEWQEKPVMCGPEEEVFSILQDKEELLLFTGEEFAKVRDPDEKDGLHQVPAKLPFAFYSNSNTGTYTILEYHKAPYNTYCIIAYGTELKPVPETMWMFQQ